jgi:EAL domain-containing protein (putative c-di-GMP-specific phosphodiesterase class I)
MGVALRGYSLDFIEGMISEQSGKVSGWFDELELSSVFQPTFSLPHRSVVGFEANLRSADAMGRPVSPATLFGPVLNYAKTSMLDMLCATMHVRNFSRPQPPRGLLLINLHPEVLLDFTNSAEFLSALFRHYRLPAGKVMIDVPGASLEQPNLVEAITAYREVGCLIAIDDFGVDNANLDTIWQASPALVKIDRTLVERAVNDRSIRQSLPKAVSLLHEMGTLVLMEGIESEDEALIALDADADFASGFYLGPMHDSISAFQDSPEVLDAIWRKYRQEPVTADSAETSARLSLEDSALHSTNIRKLRSSSPAEIGRYREERRPFLNAMQAIAARINSGKSIQSSCDEFLALPGAIRCFALDADGTQIGADVMSPRPPARNGTDFQSLCGNPRGTWSRRDFFRRAIKEPGIVQVTRQYCSLTGYTQCVTFSILAPVAGKTMVVCGDVDWTSHAKVGQASAPPSTD